MSEVEYMLCGDAKPHGRHEIDPSWVCPGKDTGSLPIIQDGDTRPDIIKPEVQYGTDATAYLSPDDKLRPVETVHLFDGSGEKITSAKPDETGTVDIDKALEAAGYEGPADISMLVGPRDADPFLPHLFCGTKEVHGGHNWSWEEGGEHTTYFCQGVKRPEPKPEEPATEATEMAGENRSLPVRWADRAMFAAEPIDASRGPEVHLLWMSPDPLGAIAAACKMYKGEVVRDLRQISDEERFEYFQQVMKTKLQAPFEFVKFHFMFEGVSRSFTHQHVRQRTAAYAQESLRFAVKEDMPQYCPPSIRENPQALHIWERSNAYLADEYQALIDLGIPAEDARGRLPHDTLTRIHYTTDLRALLDHAGNRLCTQAQFEWRLVFAKLTEVLRRVSTDNIIRANGIESVYLSGTLADAFRPVCYATGKCEFMANFDRHCAIRERVNANAEVNRPSEFWSEDAYRLDGSTIERIKPGEWLLDHKSARRK